MNTPSSSQRRNIAGFTLQEIMIALIIVGVLAALVIPRFGNSVTKVTNQEGEALLIAIYDAQKEHEHVNGAYTNNEALLDVAFTAPKHFNLPQAISANVTCEGTDTIFAIGSIRRADGAPYTLYVTDEGQISCCPAPGNDICQRLGYDAW